MHVHTSEFDPHSKDPATKPPLDPHLKALENEAIHIFREVAAEFEKSGHALFDRQGFVRAAASGAQGLLSPAACPSRCCTSNTGWKFPEMIAFRDATAMKSTIST